MKSSRIEVEQLKIEDYRIHSWVDPLAKIKNNVAASTQNPYLVDPPHLSKSTQAFKDGFPDVMHTDHLLLQKTLNVSKVDHFHPFSKYHAVFHSRAGLLNFLSETVSFDYFLLVCFILTKIFLPVTQSIEKS